MARAKIVSKWESKEDVDSVVHWLMDELDEMGTLTQSTEREVQHSLRIADAELTEYFYKQVREHAPRALHFFEEAGGG
ncbi:MAG: hypothetical protein PHV57_11170 [Methanomicrobiaceae archaeon]|nr:hypothetical protein [Methanomicrobiaceae archaeon]